MNIRLFQTDDAPAFSEYVRFHRHSTIYHTLDWKKILETVYNYKPVYIIAKKNHRLIGILPLFQVRNFSGRKKLVCLPFSHFVAPLYDSDQVLDRLLCYAEETAERLNADYIEIKCDLEIKSDRWTKKSSYFESVLDLRRNIDAIRKGIKPATARNIKKAEKQGVSIQTANRKTDYEIFYELMVETRKRQGSPPYSKVFFHHLSDDLDSSQKQLYLAFKGNVPIAGIIMLYNGAKAIYAYGASVSDRELLQARPNDLLFWTSIKDSHHKGFEIFDFGVTPYSNESLFRFKSQWGTDNSEMTYSYYLNRIRSVPNIDRSGKMFIFFSGMLKILPKSLLKPVGPIILRLLG